MSTFTSLIYDCIHASKLRPSPPMAIAWSPEEREDNKGILYTSQCSNTATPRSTSVFHKSLRMWPGYPHAVLVNEVTIPELWSEDPRSMCKAKSTLNPRVVKRIIHPGLIYKIATCKTHPDVIATITDHKYIFIWNTRTQSDCPTTPQMATSIPEVILKGHEAPIGDTNALAFNDRSLFIVSGGQTGQIFVWKLTDYQTVLSETDVSPYGSLSKLCPKIKPARQLAVHHKSRVTDCCFSPHNHTDILSGGLGGRLIRWDLREPRDADPTILNESKSGEGVTSIAWHPDKEHLILQGGMNGSVKLFDVRKKGFIFSESHLEKVTKVSWAHGVDNKYCVSSSWDSSVSIWDTEESRRVFHHVLHQGSHVLDVDWRKSGMLIASAGVKPHLTDNLRTGSLQVWRPNSYIFGD